MLTESENCYVLGQIAFVEFYTSVKDGRFTPGFGLNVDILHIYCPKFFESTNPYVELLDIYYLIFNSAAQKGYKNIISVSLGTGHHGYKH